MTDFNPSDGSTSTYEIESSTPDTYLPLYGSDRYSRRSGRSTTKRSLFMIATQVSSTGQLNETVTISGVVDPADPGVLRLAELKATDTPAKFRRTLDGYNGYIQLMKIAQLDSDETPDGFLEFSCTLEPKADAVPEGYGPIL